MKELVRGGLFGSETKLEKHHALQGDRQSKLASIPLQLISKITVTCLTKAISLNDMTSNFLSGSRRLQL